MTAEPRVHYLDAEFAYADTQTNEAIRDGDVLVVREAGVVGFLFKAWPVALRGDHEAVGFHTLAPDADITCLGKQPEKRLPITICPPDGEPYETVEVFEADPGTDYTASVRLAESVGVAWHPRPESKLPHDWADPEDKW